jgi:lipoate-protein ligase A
MHFLDLTLPTAVENVALDEGLVTAAEEGQVGAVLRIWEQEALAVVLGASGRLFEEIDVSACQRDQVAVARRSSGGGTVLIGRRAVNVSVVLAIESDPKLRAVDTAQAFVMERAATALSAFGTEVLIHGSGDLTVGGRKVAGSAQRRLRRSVLVHASVLCDGFPLELVSRYLREPKRRPAYREDRSLEAFMATLPLDRAAVVHSLREAWGAWEPLPQPPIALGAKLASEKFGRDDWIERL